MCYNIDGRRVHVGSDTVVSYCRRRWCTTPRRRRCAALKRSSIYVHHTRHMYVYVYVYNISIHTAHIYDTYTLAHKYGVSDLQKREMVLDGPVARAGCGYICAQTHTHTRVRNAHLGARMGLDVDVNWEQSMRGKCCVHIYISTVYFRAYYGNLACTQRLECG